MNDCCVVVADAAHARILVSGQSGHGPALAEIARLANADAADAANAGIDFGDVQRALAPADGGPRTGDRIESSRRFAADIVRAVVQATGEWTSGKVVLVGPARMLGLLRSDMQHVLKGRVKVAVLARDYAALSAAELSRRVDLQ